MSIGRIAAACDVGRHDARAGVKRKLGDGLPMRHAWAYLDAWERERLRMQEAGELPQLKLALQEIEAERAESA